MEYYMDIGYGESKSFLGGSQQETRVLPREHGEASYLTTYFLGDTGCTAQTEARCDSQVPNIQEVHKMTGVMFVDNSNFWAGLLRSG